MTLISATGNNQQLLRSQAGFSLTEVLIVMALIGLAAQAVVLSLPSDNRALAREVETFAARVKAAQDVAVLRNRALFGVVDGLGYRFEDDRGEAFVAQRITSAQWADDTQVLLETGGRARFQLSALGGVSPAVFAFRRGRAKLDVILDADGSIRIGRADAR
ncbi:MAG: prepilin-type N-terminal cleavage/methylation domain-containing protein [Pseudomonadota bacterium]